MDEKNDFEKVIESRCPEAVCAPFDSRAYRCGSEFPCPNAIESGKMRYCSLNVYVEVKK
jgi:hypothetical protein